MNTMNATNAMTLTGARPSHAGESDAARSVAAGVRWRVLLPLAVALLLLVATFIAIFVNDTRHRASEDIARTAASVDAMYRMQCAESIEVMRSIMELVLQDHHLASALRARDRQALLKLSAPILKELKAKNRITHFYYTLPERTVLLRVHAPDHHGDRVDRFVLQEAQRTGKPFWGNEQGPSGSFTLRVVYPWVSNGEVIGYLEMGIEFDGIMQDIKEFHDVDIFVAANKSLFDRAKWEEAQAKKEQPVHWDEFSGVLVLSRTTQEMPPPIAAHLAALGEQHSKRTFEAAWNGQVAQTIVVPFANPRGQEVGELVVLRDITAIAADSRRAVIGVAAFGAIIGGSLMLFFYFLLGRVQRDVAGRTTRLAETQRVLSTEQFERQRAERELALQHERNALLEARSRMVEDLAAAKDAAEAALRENETITDALRAAQMQLVSAARQAGMAEIATNVLHNVGNVLNSINVSASVLGKQVRASKADGLGRAVQMLGEHPADLGDFLTRDEKGRRLPGYLKTLAEALAAERASILEEIGLLARSVEHIREIITTQQSYACGARRVEPVRIEEVVDDALRMNAGALARHEVTVIKDVADLPALPLDRHRVLQILVNLISNAKQAMDGMPGPSHRIRLQVAMADGAQGRCLRICVADEGDGIAPEHLARLFTHGFTTRKNGHGFGLHSCAQAAREMGGALSAHSDGPGRGAVFTLELPIPAQESRA